jgi:hypothetical protein
MPLMLLEPYCVGSRMGPPVTGPFHVGCGLGAEPVVSGTRAPGVGAFNLSPVSNC